MTKQYSGKKSIHILSRPFIVVMLLASVATASGSYPQYKLTPATPDTSDSVSLFIVQGLSNNSCTEHYATSITITNELVFCENGQCPETYRIMISYALVPHLIDSLIKKFGFDPMGNPPQSIWQYTYNRDIVYYIPPQCCDQYSQLYSKDGVLLCAPDGGFTGGGDGKCTDFFEKASNKILIWKDKRTSADQGAVACLVLHQPVIEFGPRLNFGKLPSGEYLVYDARDSLHALTSFFVYNNTPTGVDNPNIHNDRINARRGGAGFHILRDNGSLVFSLDKAQNVTMRVYRLDGQRLFQSDRQFLSSGNHYVNLEKSSFQNMIAVFRFEGDGWSKTARVNFVK
jgi:hypothetical protein